MSQHQTDTAPTSRQALDEALFSYQDSYLPPEVHEALSDCPAAFCLPAEEHPGVVEMTPGVEVIEQGDGSQPLEVSCSGVCYTLNEESPGVFELRSPSTAQQRQPTHAVTARPPQGVTLTVGESVALSEAQAPITSEMNPELVGLVLCSPPSRGALLLDGFALGAGEAFTLADLCQGRLIYRQEGDTPGQDSFTLATPGGEVQAVEVPVTIQAPPHRAPVATAPGSLAQIQEGTTISELLGPTAPPGMGVALMALSGKGKWEVQPQGWADWIAAEEILPSRALLLDTSARVRFTPRKGWSGKARAVYRLWDGSSGRCLDRADLSASDAVGGATSFSAEALAAEASVISPLEEQLPLPPSPWLAQPRAIDLSGEGLAVVRLQGEGEWQFSLDGGRTWRALGPVYHGKARLLGPDSRVRFLPRPGGTGRVALIGRSWDGTGTAPGGTACLASRSSVGGETPFGEALQTWAWHLDQ